MIVITPAAATEIHRMQNLRLRHNLRLTLGSGSCEQFYYHLDLVDDLRGDDVIYEINGIQVGLDRQFKDYLENVHIDFAQDLMGGGFRFQNPQAAKVCGCGNAFTAHPVARDLSTGVFEI